MIRISNRLKSLVKYVSQNDNIMDVGCDHALLDIYLVQSNTVNKMYVGDVNANALANGKENIEKYALEKNITPILSYGIERINEFPIDTIIISGMGSKNIIDILSSPNLDRVYKLILQSNNNYFELRQFLGSKGFEIYEEEVIEDAKKTYINIVAIRSNNIINYSNLECEFGPILSKRKENLEYFESLHKSYENIYYASKSESAKEKLDDLESVIRDLKAIQDL